MNALDEIKAWRRRHERCNGFSKHYYQDGSNILEDNYDEIVAALEEQGKKKPFNVRNSRK